MAPIAGRPFLEHLLDRAIAQGVEGVHVLGGHAAGVISGHFGNSYGGVPVTYSFEDDLALEARLKPLSHSLPKGSSL
jgi:D-glycero-alpha-D-manno-heptose 1-phosphate guanylyltransferase